jgi:hypothetical protein
MADEGGDGVDVEEGADPGLQEVDMDRLRTRLLKQSRADDNVMLKELALLLKSGPLPGTAQDRDRLRGLGQKVLHVVVVGPAEFRKLVIEMIMRQRPPRANLILAGQGMHSGDLRKAMAAVMEGLPSDHDALEAAKVAAVPAKRGRPPKAVVAVEKAAVPAEGGAAARGGRGAFKYDLCNKVWRDERKLPDPSALLSKKARRSEDFYKNGVFLAHQVAAMQAELAPLVGATFGNINQDGDFEALPPARASGGRDLTPTSAAAGMAEGDEGLTGGRSSARTGEYLKLSTPLTHSELGAAFDLAGLREPPIWV